MHWLVLVTLLVAAPTFLLLKSRRKKTGRIYPRPDISSLGIPRDRKIPGTAVICGGSISGLLSARVCSDHFEHVVIIDPEISKSLDGKAKSRVMQYQSLHAWSILMISVLRRLWPDIDERLEKIGARKMPCDYKYCYEGIPVMKPTQPRPNSFSARRHLIETAVTSLLLENTPSVRSVDGTVRSIRPVSRNEIGAVSVRTSDNQMVELTDVSLVIDCTGTAQAGLKWLANAGYDIPGDIRLHYDPTVRYVTMYFCLSQERLASLPIPGGFESAGWLMTFLTSPSVGNNVFVINRTDNSLVQVLCGAWGTTPLPRAPTDIPPFLAELQGRAQVPIPEWIVAMVDTLVEHGEVVANDSVRFPASSNVRYEMLPSLPSNLIALGDSTMKLNPIYGQGFGKAALSSTMLNAVLSDCQTREDLLDGFSLKYFRSLAPHIQALWITTKAHDYGFSSTVPVEGEDPNELKYRFVRWYAHHGLLASVNNDYVSNTLWNVRQMMRPGTDAMKPRMIYAILKQALLSS